MFGDGAPAARFQFSKEGRCIILVLSRKVGERVLVGDKVVVTVVRIGPNSVRLGIDAPNEMNIVREEIEAKAVEPLPSIAELPGVSQ